MADYWIKMHVDIINSRDFARLSDSAWRAYFEMCLLTKNTTNDGNLGDESDIAWALRKSEDQIIDALTELEENGFITRTDTGWFINDYESSQSRMEACERMKRKREKDRRREVTEKLRGKTQTVTEENEDRYETVTARNTEKEKELREEKELITNSDEFVMPEEETSQEKSQTGKKSKKAEPKKPADEWTHFGKNREMAIEFSTSSGIKPVGKEYGKWNRAFNAFSEAGILAEHIPRIVAEMRRNELTIGGPESLLKVGRDLLARGKLRTQSQPAEPQEKIEYETWQDENGCWKSRRKVKQPDERSGISSA